VPGDGAGLRAANAGLRSVVEAKDAENAVLRAELDAGRELRRRLELRLAELERRLGMDSTDSGTPSSKERIGAKAARRARQESQRERRKDRKGGGQPGHQGKGLARDPDPDQEETAEPPAECRSCGASLDGAAAAGSRWAQVIDMEFIRKVTEWALPGLSCPCCERVTFAGPPAGACRRGVLRAGAERRRSPPDLLRERAAGADGAGHRHAARDRGLGGLGGQGRRLTPIHGHPVNGHDSASPGGPLAGGAAEAVALLGLWYAAAVHLVFAMLPFRARFLLRAGQSGSKRAVGNNRRERPMRPVQYFLRSAAGRRPGSTRGSFPLIAPLAVVLICAACGASAPAVAPEPPVLGRLAGVFAHGSGFGQIRPSRIFNGGDPTGLVSHIAWTSWGGARAVGIGTSDYVGPTQSVATGSQEAVTVVAFNLGTCDGRRMYRAVEWYFPQHGQAFNPRRYENVCTGAYVPGA
jgi:hypothetical protein